MLTLLEDELAGTIVEKLQIFMCTSELFVRSLQTLKVCNNKFVDKYLEFGISVYLHFLYPANK